MRVCITGANAGVGLEAARQLALKRNDESGGHVVSKILLACRNPEKAATAKALLEERTGRKDDNVFEILIVDVANLESIRRAVDQIQKLDCLILNAGGFIGEKPREQTSNGTMKIFDLNVLGSVYMTDLLIAQNKIAPQGSVLYISSETARGISLNTCHKFQSTPDNDKELLDEMKSLCNGTYYNQKGAHRKDMDVYGRCKLVGTLWTGSMARTHADTGIRFVAVSPGNTAGTDVVNHMRLPSSIRWIANKIALPMMVCMGRFHSLQVGAQRYMDVIFDHETSSTYKNGHFYGSFSSWPTGPMADQLKHLEWLYDPRYQDAANQAIHSFLPS